MEMKSLTIARVAVASVCGTIQLVLVALGSASLLSTAKEAYPEARHFTFLAVLLPLLSLFWPIYIFRGIRRSPIGPRGLKRAEPARPDNVG